MSTDKKRIQIRVDQDVIDALDQLVEHYSLDRSSVIRMLIKRDAGVSLGGGTTTPPREIIDH